MQTRDSPVQGTTAATSPGSRIQSTRSHARPHPPARSPRLQSHPRTRLAGARVVVDVTQMAGAAPVTMTQWGVDALVCSGYKWLSAPGGVALLVMTENLAAATPVVVGWKGSATPFDFTPQELYLAADARRFELSTMSYNAAAGLLTSIKLLTGIGLTAISEHASALAADLAEQTAPLGWAPYRTPDERSASGHIVSLSHPAAAADQVQAALASRAQHPHQLPRRRYPGIPARLQQQPRHSRPRTSARHRRPTLGGQRSPSSPQRPRRPRSARVRVPGRCGSRWVHSRLICALAGESAVSPRWGRATRLEAAPSGRTGRPGTGVSG